MRKSLLFSLISLFSGCTYVQPGYVAIKVNAYGNQKGVEDYPISTGRTWYNPITTSIFDYPTFMQNQVWQGEERISFNTSQGSRITCDVALSYTVDPNKVPHIFVKHRTELPAITHGYLRNKVRDAINQHSSEYTAIDILGSKSQELLLKAKQELVEVIGPDGFIVDTLSFISAPEPEDANVKQSISLVISSTQQAIQAENKVKQVEAEARQEIAKSEGKGKAILVEAESQAKANEILSKSLTAELVRYKMIEKWNGAPPQVMGGEASSMFQIKN